MSGYVLPAWSRIARQSGYRLGWLCSARHGFAMSGNARIGAAGMSVLGRVLHGWDGPGNARQAMRGKAWI